MTTTVGSSDPAMISDGYDASMPRLFIATTTNPSSAIEATGFWAGQGSGSRGTGRASMRVGDVLLHVQSTATTFPGRVTLHSVIGSTANVASTSLSSGFAARYDITVASATST